jgi:hypothetical protein
MEETEVLVKALNEAERKIQLALREAGYFAYSVKFTPMQGRTPKLEILARAWEKRDEELINP